ECVMTVDLLTDRVDFELDRVDPRRVGRKALAVNLSDLAAMGAKPICALISLAPSRSWSVEQVDEFYAGLNRCGSAYGCAIAGGDLSRTLGPSFISVAAMGSVRRGRALKRSGAKPGDVICLTGELGGSRTGLEVLESGSPDRAPHSVGRFLEPVPRLDISSWLSGFRGITSMIDISDGLASELWHLCRESATGCEISSEALPIAEEAKNWALSIGGSVLDYGLYSGEEYELVFTVDGRRIGRFLAESKGLPRISVIGRMVPAGQGMTLSGPGMKKNLEPSGWNHFHKP
ncbi:thiamine-phosphate kinase, partial [bacterium]|nr:thiamine-phosphate kinase [bacterium]